MGVVYRAVDPTLNRPVALKVLAPHLGGDPEALTRFHREAAAAANLKHPHIATVYEFGEHDGQPYIAFEWIEGRTLKDLIAAEGRLPLDRSLRLFDQIAGALDYAHARGVIHRDIKPSNIVVGPDDQATVVDFGLAWLATATTLTASGAMFGTPRYMSPEQAMGRRLDGRSDLYSLAVALYEMLTGQAPFDASTPHALLHDQIYTPPPPITELNPRLPPEVESALMAALAKDPSQRFPNVSAFGAALRGLPASAPAAEPSRRPPAAPVLPADSTRPPVPPAATAITPGKLSSSRRFGWLIGLAALLCLGLLAALGLPRLFGSGAPLATATGNASDPTSVAETLIASITASDPTRKAAAETLIASTFIAPSQTASALVTPLTPPHAQTPTSFPAPTLTPTLPSPTPLVPPREGGLWPMFAGDAAQTGFVAEGLMPLSANPRWSRNPRSSEGTGLVVGGGRVVFGVAGGAVRALDWATGITAWESPLGSNVIGTPALYVSGDGALAFAAVENGELYALNLSDGGLAWSKSGDELSGAAYGLTVGGDGALYAATDTGWLYAFNPLTGEVYWSLDLTQSDSFYAPPAITGAGIFLSSAYQALTAINPATLETMWRAETQGTAYAPPNAAEGLGAVFAGTDLGWVYAFSMADGGEWWSAQVSSAITGLANDGARLFAAASDGSVYAWEAATGAALWALNAGSTITGPPLTDGSFVLIGTDAGNVLYLDAASGVEAAGRRLSLSEPILSVAPAGSWLFLWTGSNIYGIGP